MPKWVFKVVYTTSTLFGRVLFAIKSGILTLVTFMNNESYPRFDSYRNVYFTFLEPKERLILKIFL